MNLTLISNGTLIRELKVDGGHFCYCICSDAIDRGDYKIVLFRNGQTGQTLPVIAGTSISFHDGLLDGGIEIGSIHGDDFVLNGRPTLARMVNLLTLAIDNLETIRLEVV